MIKTIFFEILNMSITASFAILAVITLRYLFRNQPKVFSYVLWSVVLFRLLCPWSVPLNISAFNALPPAQTTEEGYIEYNIGETVPEEENFPVEISPVDHMPVENRIVVTSVNNIDYSLLFSVLWLLGVMYIISNNLIAISELKKTLADSVRCRNNIYYNNNISTAFVMGIISPVIYLPCGLECKQQEYIIQHEKIHIKRKDYFFKFLGFIALCIHWFNPLVWVAFHFAEKDMEMSCDEAVIRKMNKADISGYSQTLLALAAANNALPQLAFGESDTKGRIMNIFNYKNPGLKFTAVIILTVILTISAFAVNPVKEPVPMDDNPPVLVENTREYTVKDGDTVWRIAENFHMDIAQLYELNPDKDFSYLAVGDILTVKGQPKVPQDAYSFYIKSDETKTVMAETALVTYFKTLESQPVSDYVVEDITIINDVPGENFDYIVVGEYISPYNKDTGYVSVSALYIRDDGNGHFTITGAEGDFSGEYQSAFINENMENTGSGIKFIWPVPYGRVSRGFTGQYPGHNGLDISAETGTDIKAVYDGIVTVAEELTTGNGIYCIIDHGGISTLYAHCSELLVSVGDEVKQGDVIAKVGSTGNSTGPHLHLEAFTNQTEERFNPYLWI